MEVKEYNLEVKKKKLNTKTKVIKIIVILCFVFVILAFIAYKIITPFYIIPSEIHELNENVNIPYKFGTPLEEYDFDSSIWKCYSDYNNLYFTMDEYESFTFEGYPDYACDYKFTNYWSINPETSVFGIHVGDSLESVESVMKSYGYEQDEKSDQSINYSKGRVRIWIALDTYSSSTDTNTSMISTVSDFYIFIKSTDWLHKGNYK